MLKSPKFEIVIKHIKTFIIIYYFSGSNSSIQYWFIPAKKQKQKKLTTVDKKASLTSNFRVGRSENGFKKINIKVQKRSDNI